MNKDSIFMLASSICDGTSCPYFKEHSEKILNELFKFAMEIKGLSFVEALRWIVNSDLKEISKEMDDHYKKQSEDDRSIFI